MTITITPRGNINDDDAGFAGFGTEFGSDDLHFFADENDNLILGGIGHDKVEGEGGNDTINGGEGNDTLNGGSGDDIIDGQGGSGEKDKDKLFGDDGNDILRAGHGFDELTGGSGNDIFETYALGHFSFKDFTIGQDRFLFDTAKTGVLDVNHLVQLITNVDQREDGVTVEFLDNTVSIELVGINLADISADMVIFSL